MVTCVRRHTRIVLTVYYRNCREPGCRRNRIYNISRRCPRGERPKKRKRDCNSSMQTKPRVWCLSVRMPHTPLCFLLVSLGPGFRSGYDACWESYLECFLEFHRSLRDRPYLHAVCFGQALAGG